jgi:hypothetical protein
VRVVASAGAGFLLAVLWFDLMFDVQVVGHRGVDLPAAVRESIATYYARVTTAARPMNRLVATTMFITVGALVAETARGDLPAWRTWPALVCAIAAVGLAAGRTVRNAVRLGTRAGDAQEQSRLARRVLRDHLVCIAAITAVLVLQLLPA